MMTRRVALRIVGLALFGGIAGCGYAKQSDLDALQATYAATHDTLVAFMEWARDHRIRLPVYARMEPGWAFDTILPPPPPPRIPLRPAIIR